VSEHRNPDSHIVRNELLHGLDRERVFVQGYPGTSAWTVERWVQNRRTIEFTVQFPSGEMARVLATHVTPCGYAREPVKPAWPIGSNIVQLRRPAPSLRVVEDKA
jgi:hypothetical protein